MTEPVDSLSANGSRSDESSDGASQTLSPPTQFNRRQDLTEKTIQLLVGDRGNREAISSLLEEQFTIVTGPPLRDADLYLVENSVFPEYRDALTDLIDRNYPVFVPVVLICRHREETWRGVESRPDEGILVIDDILEAPLTKRQLRRRLHSLLIRREQSVLHRQREQRIEQLLDATRQVMETTDRDEVVQFTADVTKNILGFASNVVRLIDEGRQLRPVGVTEEANVNLGDRPIYPLEADDNPAARSFVNQETLLYDDLSQLEDEYDRGGTGAGIYVPIGNYGVLSIVETEPNAFEQSDAEFASILAANTEAALDRIEYEQELQERELHRQILSRVLRHNIRNDLNVIQIDANRLSSELDESLVERAESILERSEQLLETSENTRTISKMIEDGVVRESRNLTALVEEVATTYRERYKEATIEVDAPCPRYVRICQRFVVAIEQLVENAIEHNDRDEPRVALTVDPDELPKVIVEDNGPGIPEIETQPIDQNRETPLEHGSGMGLWLVNWMVDASDGALSFESTPNGTKVEIEFSNCGDRGEDP